MQDENKVMARNSISFDGKKEVHTATFTVKLDKHGKFYIMHKNEDNEIQWVEINCSIQTTPKKKFVKKARKIVEREIQEGEIVDDKTS